ncbi:protein FAM110A-like [Paramormyrops kingsleyae]|uniref:protein FAM110A-like n=1 Tax=Paramormyrops kingsleyae TaxID=1676925 RepID=UPI000CD61E37|nr:protein FAM110B-like [Paramormyrops kingsleyae]XP_023650932.1 protein FAM110B-like [Paramormyrops kingsleyae]XP_023650933.1 protein FAM110B-like [Paramormyrops kingsleyae]XP_023650934.1 protein FAM110B-like [Paramormyrops kingsleyae]XP_023650935.1 protein FAM110B-like [Paramormyrops kingsleyae]XP_023650936.1 protein FAM110B-like [Paramormyrops kingsleyae]
MPVETLRPSDGRLAGAPFTSAMPFRILNKGPEYFRRPLEPGARKLSAVERLEADKAKYVKSQQVASTRQEPVKPPAIRKPLLSPSVLLQCRAGTPVTRKAPRRHGISAPLNLDALNNLINVCEPPASHSALRTPLSESRSGNPIPAEPSSSDRQLNSNSSSTSSSSSLTPLSADQNRRPPVVPARALRAGTLAPCGSAGTVAVRRVDVRPQAVLRKPQRTPQAPPRLVPQLQVARPQVPPPPTASATLPSPLPSSPLLLHATLPPASPAFTRLSSASSRGSPRRHPSLHRSKSDLSDRYSRATADLERFFNYCGLDPEDVDSMGVERFARASSDIVSVSKLRSVSTPSSECGALSRHSHEGPEEEVTPASERTPYGISVIERNARVIKWLYGIRQARDALSVSNV